jgi:hypothetical protein
MRNSVKLNKFRAGRHGAEGQAFFYPEKHQLHNCSCTRAQVFRDGFALGFTLLNFTIQCSHLEFIISCLFRCDEPHGDPVS